MSRPKPDRPRISTLLLLASLLIITLTGVQVDAVKMINFTIYSAADHIKIHWTSTARMEATYYNVERSHDGKTFETIMKVEDPGGEPPKITEFIEADFDPLPGWSYYRIRRTDAKGKDSFTHMVPVFFGIDRLKLGELIVPDPLDLRHIHTLSLSEFDNQEAVLVLRNEQGIEFYDKVILSVQDDILRTDANGAIPSGIYTITASSRDALVGLLITVE